MRFRRRARDLVFLLPPVFWIGLTFFGAHMLIHHVDLKPAVEKNFFFAEDDPPFQEDLKILALFPEPEQMLINARGPVRSSRYAENIGELSENLLGMSEIFALQSLTIGPEDTDKAFDSPLWSRLIVAKDGRSTDLMLFIRDVPLEPVVWQVEEIAKHFDQWDFKLQISGPPYVIELIRRNLVRDLEMFSLAAFGIFTLLMFGIFRSWRVLIGTVVCCLNASILTLFSAHWLNIRMGPLTANLSTIVFVLTLSHIAYMTFNWKRLVDQAGSRSVGRETATQAARMTLPPSFWSMFTTFLGFVSLIFVPAAPLRKLGVSGSLGTLIALMVPYLMYPSFLRWKTPRRGYYKYKKASSDLAATFLSKRHLGFSMGVLLVVIMAVSGLHQLNGDPGLLSYFKKGSPLRDGLDYIDRNGGSSVLKIVISDKEGRKFNESDVYEKFWELQKGLEHYEPVGVMLTLPLIMAEAKERVRFSFLIQWEWILEALSKPEWGGITKYFVTDDRTQSLIFLRMKDSYQDESRYTVISRIRRMVEDFGFRIDHVGGLYLLQGELSKLVISSLSLGLCMLIGIFVVMGLALSVSLQVTAAMFIGLCIIPAWVFGLIGHLRIPIDIISAPATNIAIAMGVDAMIHLILMVRRCYREGMIGWDAWAEARSRMWRPVMSSSFLVCAGFSIFLLSNFPPTQRFGFAIVIGTLMAPLAALFVLPSLGGRGRRPSRFRPQPPLNPPKLHSPSPAGR